MIEPFPIDFDPESLRLDLSNRRLSQITVPKFVWELRPTSLSVQGNELTRLWPELFEMDSILSLDVSNNFLGSLPSQMRFLQRLRQLFALNNQLHDLPQETLEFSHNKFQEFPKSLLTLSQLKRVHFRANLIKELPELSWKHSKITELNLHKNLLHRFPTRHVFEGALHSLILSDNVLTEIPESIGYGDRLLSLHINHNPLRFISSALCKLKNLMLLVISKEQVSLLPKNLPKSITVRVDPTPH